MISFLLHVTSTKTFFEVPQLLRRLSGAIATECAGYYCSFHRLADKTKLVHRGHRGPDVQPDLERAAAKRMGATTVELKSSHVPMLSRPLEVLDVIRKAAAAVANPRFR